MSTHVRMDALNYRITIALNMEQEDGQTRWVDVYEQKIPGRLNVCDLVTHINTVAQEDHSDA